jgi:ubiquinone/menaquinone biosynthesis C-methylase UbiE
MTFERQSYELPEIWQATWFSRDDYARCAEVASLLPDDARTLVDVGCGNGLFVNRLGEREPQRFARLAAVDRSAAALAHVRVPRCRASVDALPLRDRSFDVATSMEVLEHLPVAVFPLALRELARVARSYVLVSVPYKQDLAASMSQCPSCLTRFNADYHMRTFDEAIMVGLLEREGYRLVTHRLMGPQTTYADRVWRARVRAWWHRESRLPSYAICPVCGFHDAEELRRESQRREMSHATAAAATEPPARLARWRPAVTTYQWICALYERERR